MLQVFLQSISQKLQWLANSYNILTVGRLAVSYIVTVLLFHKTMNVADMYRTALRRTATTSWNYPLDTDAVIDLNTIYHDFCGEIRKINENYFYDRMYFDVVPYQNKYDFPAATATTRTMQKVLAISMKYQVAQNDDFIPNNSYTNWTVIYHVADWYTYAAKTDFTSGATFVSADRQQVYLDYVPVRERSFSGDNIESNNFATTSTFSPNVWVWTTLASDPQYIIWQNRDNDWSMLTSLYIYPYSTVAVKHGIIVDAVSSEVDLTATSTESDILFERSYHNVLVEWRKWLIYQTQLKHNEAAAQYQEYMKAKSDALEYMTDRTIAPNYVTTPYLINLS